jgi:hypothetical protein
MLKDSENIIYEKDNQLEEKEEDCNDPKPNSFLESLTTTNLLSY